MKKRLSAFVAVLAATSLGGQAFALGTASYSSELISPRSLGQGGTGVAGTMNDPVAAYTNPAALTSLAGTQFTVGGVYANASPTFTADSGHVDGARATSVVAPTFAASTQLGGGKWALGLAAVSPYGLETHFDGDSAIRYETTDARLRMVDLTPSVAYKVCDGFSVGAGLDYYNVFEGALEKKVDSAGLNAQLTLAAGGTLGQAAAAAAASKDANSRLNGNGDGLGYHIGTTMRFNEKHQLGIVYHSAVRIGLSGNVQLTDLNGASASAGVFGGSSFSSNVTAPLFMPQNVQMGYSFSPNEKLNMELDAAWYDWYAARQLGVVYSGLTGTQASILSTGNPQIFKPRKTINFGLGANYKKSDSLDLRAGAYYQAAALPESAFDPAFIDLPRYAATVGVGYKLTPALTLDAAYNAVFFHSRHVTVASTDPFNNNGYSGYFDSFAHLLSVSLTYRTAAHL